MAEIHTMKTFEEIPVIVREEIGYTKKDANIIYDIASHYVSDIFQSQKILSAYLIGSYAAGTFTPNRSDIDFVAFYDGEEVIFFETPIEIRICNDMIQRDINVSVCCRPVKWINYWNSVPERLEKGILWKEVNAYEDYMMLLNHGIHVYGEDIRDQLKPLYQGFDKYLLFRNTISATICKTEKVYPNLLNVAKTIISISRDAVYMWTGQYCYSIYQCYQRFSEIGIDNEAVSILKDAIDVVDQKWDEVMQNQAFEVQLAKLIRKCIRFTNYLKQYDDTAGLQHHYRGLLEIYNYIPYHFPPCENAFCRKVRATVTDLDITNIQLI